MVAPRLPQALYVNQAVGEIRTSTAAEFVLLISGTTIQLLLPYCACVGAGFPTSMAPAVAQVTPKIRLERVAFFVDALTSPTRYMIPYAIRYQVLLPTTTFPLYDIRITQQMYELRVLIVSYQVSGIVVCCCSHINFDEGVRGLTKVLEPY